MNRGKRIKFTFAAVILGAAVSLAGCGGGGSSQSTSASKNNKVSITFSWWSTPTRTKMTKKAVKLFEKKYPNIKVNMQYMPWSGYWSKLSTEIAGGTEPDVMQMDGSRLKQFVNQHRVMDLSKVNINTSDLNKSTVDLGKVNGKLYAVTTAVNAQLLIYNPKILKQAGVSMPTGKYSWADFEKLCEKIHQKTGKYGMPDEMEQGGLLSYYALTNGEQMYSADGKSLAISKKTLKNWFQYWLDMQEKGIVPSAQKSASYDHTDAQSNPFMKKKAAFAWIFLGEDGLYQTQMKQTIGRALLPGWGNHSYPLHPAMYWTISSQTKHPDAAAKLVNFIENNPKVSQIFGNDRGIPANVKNMKNDAKKTNDPIVKKQDQFMDKVEKISTPSKLSPPGAGQVGDLLKNISQQVTFKKLTPSQAANKFYKQANQDLAQADF